MFSAFCLTVILHFWIASASNLVERNNSSGYVTVSGGRFQLDGKQVAIDFPYV